MCESTIAVCSFTTGSLSPMFKCVLDHKCRMIIIFLAWHLWFLENLCRACIHTTTHFIQFLSTSILSPFFLTTVKYLAMLMSLQHKCCKMVSLAYMSAGENKWHCRSEFIQCCRLHVRFWTQCCTAPLNQRAWVFALFWHMKIGFVSAYSFIDCNDNWYTQWVWAFVQRPTS